MSDARADARMAEQTRRDYAREWGIAHGYIDAPAGLPLEPMHQCPARHGWFWHGSRESCPHCKIAAPAAGRGRD